MQNIIHIDLSKSSLPLLIQDNHRLISFFQSDTFQCLHPINYSNIALFEEHSIKFSLPASLHIMVISSQCGLSLRNALPLLFSHSVHEGSFWILDVEQKVYEHLNGMFLDPEVFLLPWVRPQIDEPALNFSFHQF